MIIKPLTLLGLGAVAATLLVTPAPSQEPAPGPVFRTPGEAAETKAFMRQKLLYTQNVLEGLTLEQFDMVAENGRLMRNMTQSNIFLRIGSPEYLKQTKNFVRSVDQLILSANDQDLKDATKALNKVTENCVACHGWYRSAQIRNRPQAKSPALLINPAEPKP